MVLTAGNSVLMSNTEVNHITGSKFQYGTPEDCVHWAAEWRNVEAVVKPKPKPIKIVDRSQRSRRIGTLRITSPVINGFCEYDPLGHGVRNQMLPHHSEKSNLTLWFLLISMIAIGFFFGLLCGDIGLDKAIDDWVRG